MQRRQFLQTSGLLAAGYMVGPALASAAGPLTGKIRKSLKWSMVQDRSLSLPETLAKIKTLGYEGIEPRFREVEPEAVDAWKKARDESGLIIDGLVAVPFDQLREGVDRIKELGGSSLLLVVRYDEKKPYKDNWQETQAAIKDAAPYAEKQGIQFLIENVWASFLISPLDMKTYVDEIDSPAVGVHFDIGNVIRWGVAEHWIEVLGSRIKKLDLKEFDLKVAMNEGLRKGFGMPMGTGSVNWKAVREELVKLKFSGWAAAEVPGGDFTRLADVSKQMDEVFELV
jgi:hexulose-6-phosphate isomerase